MNVRDHARTPLVSSRRLVETRSEQIDALCIARVKAAKPRDAVEPPATIIDSASRSSTASTRWTPRPRDVGLNKTHPGAGGG